ncbi:LysR family transcriptional regulator [Sinorhizobium meliloti]|uniref:LysR family transcriptional regulator n=1 Tax=Rhizobium meliloti TaxID=382 RepID=UPI00237FFCF3|nr:LysR family transcriptional regulator [Sinorhizobium meliloti]
MLEERSVARCAERLFVSPSAVSHALAKLSRCFQTLCSSEPAAECCQPRVHKALSARFLF